ncbi:MAG: NADH-quinone oxidoreductase subunit M [Verrucomicrobiota bacterium]
MMLLFVILIPLAGGLLAGLLGTRNAMAARWTGLLAMLLDGAVALAAWIQAEGEGRWATSFEWEWIPAAGVRLYLAVDGFSFPLVLLTVFLGIIAVLVSWQGITQRVAFFHFNLLWVLAGTLGVFLALDLLAFFFFWELMVIPMFLLIAIWGHEHRSYAAVKFFLFTQASGLLMLVSIVGLYVLHGRATGQFTFRYDDLLGNTIGGRAEFWLMLGFFVAFAVKLPAFPFHPWLADAHTEAPTAGSLILAGLLLKTGAYGLVRFVVPFFPEAAADFAPVAMTMGVAGVSYGAMLAFAQSDFKRLVAYTSVSHMGFVLLGVFAWNTMAVQGVLMQMICHGVSTGALFIIAGALQDRMHTRDLGKMGGLWSVAPKLAGFGLLFALASLGLPGLGNFVGEFLVLIGSFQSSRLLTILAALTLVASAVYSLRLVQRAFHGGPSQVIADFGKQEMAVMVLLAIAIVWLGLAPQPVFNMSHGAVERMLENGGGP